MAEVLAALPDPHHEPVVAAVPSTTETLLTGLMSSHLVSTRAHFTPYPANVPIRKVAGLGSRLPAVLGSLPAAALPLERNW